MAVTDIASRQIRDGAITNAKVAAGAAIASSKLADGANFLNKDGTVTMTGALNMGSQPITNLSTPSANTDAANKSYVDTQIAALSSLFDSKGSAKAATTANVAISNPATSSFDGITLTNGDRLFVRAQTAPAENGLYVFNGSASALTRTGDMDSWLEAPGALFAVEQGAIYADTLWLCTSDQGGTIGSTALTFQQLSVVAGLSSSNFVDKEVPSGAINGANTAFTLANTPTAGSEHVYLNGVLQESGSGNDYTITTNAITYLTAPLTGDKIRVTYRK